MKKLKAVFTNPNLLAVTLFGFSGGLPLLMTGATLRAWMRESGLDLTTIGFFSIVSLPYGWKILWSPLMDRFVLPFGRRRGWLLVSQMGVMLSLVGLSTADPAKGTTMLAVWAVVVAFFSASQDIVIDAYRREILPDDQIGLGSSLYVFAYRMAMLVAGAGAFSMSKRMSWSQVYLIVAACMLVGLVTTLLCKEPAVEAPPPRSLKESVVGPLREFFTRDFAWTILAFVLLYKIGEAMAINMLNPLYIDLKIDKDAVAAVAKGLGIWAMVFGGMAGGFLIVQLGIYRALWLFGILQSSGLLLFSWLARSGQTLVAENAAAIAADPKWTVPSAQIVPLLSTAISYEYFTNGMATAAFVAFMATQTNKRFTATQYALFTSLTSLPQTIFGFFSGAMADFFGWEIFFVACAACTIPGLLLLFRLKKLLVEGQPSKPAGKSAGAATRSVAARA